MKDIFILLISFYLIAISNAFVLANNAKSSSNSMIQMALGPLGAVTKLVHIITIIIIVIFIVINYYRLDETIFN